MRNHERVLAAFVAGCFALTVGAQSVPKTVVRSGNSVGGGRTAQRMVDIAVNPSIGYAILLEDNLPPPRTVGWGHIAGGSAGNLLRPQMRAGRLQAGLGREVALSGVGELLYSAPIANRPGGVGVDWPGFLDSVWIGTSCLVQEGSSIGIGAPVARPYWCSSSGLSLTVGGTPYWIGGETNVPGSRSMSRAIYSGVGGNQQRVLGGGDVLASVDEAISHVEGVRGFAVSPGGVRLITSLRTTDGAGTSSPSLVSLDLKAVPAVQTVLLSAGDSVLAGLAGERWRDFFEAGIVEPGPCIPPGSWWTIAQTDAESARDDVVVRDGQVVFREGQIADGITTAGRAMAGAMNQQGDLALVMPVVWPDGSRSAALLFNGAPILRWGDAVDVDGDGSIEPGQRVRGILPSVGLSARGPDQRVTLFVRARVNTSDAVIRLSVLAGTSNCCPADLDNGTGTGVPDGWVNQADLDFFIPLYESGDPRADLDDGSATGAPDGFVTGLDFDYFIFHFEAGC